MKLSTIAKEIHARLYGADLDFSTLAIDSRKMKKGELFAAIVGEQFDGHDFIHDAILSGAQAVLASRAPLSDEEKSVSFLVVKDTTQALGEFAAFWRKQYPIPMIGITGSCGKTTVKGMTEAICQLQGKTLATKGNFNNHIGLPLTLLQLDESYQQAVIEMGANHSGDIRYLGNIAKPTISVINNISPAHLQGFGSVEGVAKTKAEIYEILPPDGIAILNIEEPFSEKWREIIHPRTFLTFGLSKQADIYASDIVLDCDFVAFQLHILKTSCSVKINIPGKHTVINALAAAACTHALGINIETIVKGLASFEGVPGRLRRFAGLKGATVIDDSYNANPGSMKAALEVLATFSGQRMFIMGDMGELGEETIHYHSEIGKTAQQIGIERLYAVGSLSEHAVKAFGVGAKHFPDKQSLLADLKVSLNSQTVILVKGSRSAGMEVVTKALTEHKG